jgi:predicted nucleotidyltransferase component of viral defense system
LIVHYKLFHDEGTIFLDLNERGKMLLKFQKIDIPHFYSEYIPKFKVNCLHKNEIIAEKVMATCERYKPRDYFDIYYIIKNKVPISKNLLKRKFKEKGLTFTSALIFKKTNKVFRDWDNDLAMVVKTRHSFREVIEVIKKYFKYKE